MEKFPGAPKEYTQWVHNLKLISDTGLYAELTVKNSKEKHHHVAQHFGSYRKAS